MHACMHHVHLTLHAMQSMKQHEIQTEWNQELSIDYHLIGELNINKGQIAGGVLIMSAVASFMKFCCMYHVCMVNHSASCHACMHASCALGIA